MDPDEIRDEELEADGADVGDDTIEDDEDEGDETIEGTGEKLPGGYSAIEEDDEE